MKTTGSKIRNRSETRQISQFTGQEPVVRNGSILNPSSSFCQFAALKQHHNPIFKIKTPIDAKLTILNRGLPLMRPTANNCKNGTE